MNNATRATCFTLSVMLMAPTVRAQEVVAVPSGDDQISAVHKDEKAPFQGQLFSNDTALRWANWLVQYKNLVHMNEDIQKKLCTIQTDTLQSKLDLERKQYQEVTQEMLKDLKVAQEQAANPPFYKTATFGLVMGVVGAVALVAGSAALVNAVK